MNPIEFAPLWRGALFFAAAAAIVSILAWGTHARVDPQLLAQLKDQSAPTSQTAAIPAPLSDDGTATR